MSIDWLPGKRYLLRELLPRAIVLTVFFKLLPKLPGHLFDFRGNWIEAAAFGMAFTAFFCLLGSYIMGAQNVRDFLNSNSKKWWFIPLNISIVIGAPAAATAVATFFASAFVVHFWWAYLVSSVLLNVACAITHDYKNGSGG